jgi:hypothetical protein
MEGLPIRVLFLSLVALFSAMGCKNDEACVKARNAASDVWKAVTETAGKNKVAPNIGLDDLPTEKKAPHVEAWSTIEKHADMISSSFAYPKITWKTANPAQQKVNAAFDGYFAKDQFKTFAVQLKDANDKFKATTDACGE